MKKFSLLFAICCFFLSVLGGADILSAEITYSPMGDISKTGGIKGTVKCANGDMIEGGWIFIIGESFVSTTDEEGNFVLWYVPEGTYTIKISWESGEEQRADISVKRKMITDLGLITVTCPVTDQCSGRKDGFPCSDGDDCTTNDACKNGVCIGNPVNCDDGNPCTEDECAPVVGCTHQPLNGVSCDDKDACTEKDACSNGTCIGTPVNCNTWNHCAKDECDPKTGCTHQPLDGMICDDGNACTTDDACRNAVCIGTPVNCDDGNQCTKDICDQIVGCTHQPLTGASCDDGNACMINDICSNGTCIGTPLNCDDGNTCTEDSCDPKTGCIHTPANGAPCDDHTACTAEDLCTNGVCIGLQVSCDDGNPCTQDECDPLSGCNHKPLNGTACDDGNACTTNDLCTDGACDGTPINCNDGNFCTNDSCDPSKGCVHTHSGDPSCPSL